MVNQDQTLRETTLEAKEEAVGNTTVDLLQKKGIPQMTSINGTDTHTHTTSTTGLVGKYFHTTTTCPGGHRVAEWQGAIIGEPGPGLLLVQLFEWITGCDSTQEFLTLSDFVAHKPVLYDSAEQMNFSYRGGAMGHRCWRDGCPRSKPDPDMCPDPDTQAGRERFEDPFLHDLDLEGLHDAS